MAGDHYLLLYDYVEDIAERRDPFRGQHLARIAAEKKAGRMLMAGALGDPPRGGAFVFEGASHDEIEQFVSGDPYVEAGLVTKWYIEHWNLV